ncbi:hypothetical protein [Streptosporangium sp. NPDC003464]
MVHTSSLLPCHVRHLPGGVVELMPIVMPMNLDPAQRRALAAELLRGLDGEDYASHARRGLELCNA